MSCVCFCALHLSHLSFSNFNFEKSLIFLEWTAIYAATNSETLKREMKYNCEQQNISSHYNFFTIFGIVRFCLKSLNIQYIFQKREYLLPTGKVLTLCLCVFQTCTDDASLIGLPSPSLTLTNVKLLISSEVVVLLEASLNLLLFLKL